MEVDGEESSVSTTEKEINEVREAKQASDLQLSALLRDKEVAQGQGLAPRREQRQGQGSASTCCSH